MHTGTGSTSLMFFGLLGHAVDEKDSIDYVGLADFLQALGSPVRLQVLEALKFPHALSEVRVRPLRLRPGENAARPAARQTVETHLKKLLEADLVREQSADDEAAGRARRFVVNTTKLYALTDSLRRLTTQYAGRGPIGDNTGTVIDPKVARPTPGPRLVLVQGVYEGRSYPLSPSTAEDGRWTIGRGRGLAVSLDYDPFVSVRNSAITRSGSAFTLLDLPGNKNGTSVNWERLPAQGNVTLRTGDVIGVGRSLLSFVTE